MEMDFAQHPTNSNNPARLMRPLFIAVCLVSSISPLFAQVLYGTTRAGGNSGGGTIFKTYADGSGFTTEYNFQIDSDPGRNPDYSQMVLIPGVSGNPDKLYGLTTYGGKYDGGVLYEFIPGGNTYTVKVDFDFLKGINPFGSLVVAADGKLYGMTRNAGVNYGGTLFEYDPAGSGTFTKKIDFDGALKGANPFGGLTLLSTNNKLYGMTSNGGVNDLGVIFEFNPADGTYVKRFDFDGLGHGAAPFRNLTEANGKLYGMTTLGGANNQGVLFQFDPADATAGSVIKKFDFDGTSHGSYPPGSLLLSKAGVTNGHLVGATNLGGSLNAGVLFDYVPGATTIAVRVNFDGGLSGIGAGPGPALVQLADGTIYGTCEGGGFNTAGTLFAFNIDGTATKKVDFGGLSGFAPKSGMTLVGSLLYGTTAGGGQTESGVIFSFNPAATTPAINKLLDFNLASNGAYPENSMALAPNGKLYGMTPDGGANGWGVLFEYNPITKVYTKKIDFDDAANKGANPSGNLALAPNGKLYGMTFTGGSVNQGLLFEYDPVANTITKKVDFDYAFDIGVNPRGGLALAANGKFYGMTTTAGIGFTGVGTLFEYVAGATSVTKKVDFDRSGTASSKGANPYGNLALFPSNGKLYGMTSVGGLNDLGVLFEFNPSDGTYTKKFDFDGANGANPFGSLVLASNGKFYGLTSFGAQGFGVLFQYDPLDITASAFSKKVELNGTNGPIGTMANGANGKLYGMSLFGGSVDDGNFFEYDPATGTLTIKEEFNGSNGAYPGYGALVSVTLPPVFTSFTPGSGAIGTVVTITGNNFDTTPSNNIVYFGATEASVITATRTQLVVTVPGGATDQPVSVTVNALTTYSKTPFVVTFPSSGVINTSSLNASFLFNLPANASPWGIAIGDMDGDGQSDLIVANGNTSNVSVIRNTSGPASVALANFTFGTGASPRGVAVGDLDGDGKLDAVVTNATANSVSVLRNTSSPGTFSFSAFGPYLTFPLGSPFGVAIGDIDGDGKPEFAVANISSNNVSVFQNTSKGASLAFSNRVDFTAGSGPQGVAMGDFDGDGKVDLAVSNYITSNVSILRNTSTLGTLDVNSFATAVNFPTGSGPRNVSVGDFDSDGKLDLATANESASTISVLRNVTTTPGIINNTLFSPKVDFNTGPGPYMVAIGDVDGDDKLDLAASNGGIGTGTSFSVLRNTGSSFATKVDFTLTSGTNPSGIAIGDLDGDGRPDIVTANNVSNNVSVFLSAVPFLPPTITSFAPLAGGIGSTVILTGTNFDPITDNDKITFNGTAASVDSSSTTYIRTYVPPGATSGTITVTVHGLTATSTTSFVVDATPPVISGPSPANVAFPVSADIAITVQVSDPESNVDNAEISYGPANASAYTVSTQNMNKGTGNAWSWVVPKDQFKDSGLQFEIGAYSGGGYSTQTFSVGLTYNNAGLSIPYTSGTAVGNYRVIALPLDLNAKTVNDVFSDETSLGAYGDKTKWRAFHFTGGPSGTNQELTGSSSLKPGEGYWFLAASGSSFGTGQGNTVGSDASPVTTPVVSGWNQIGNPYTFNLSVDDIVNSSDNTSLTLSKSSFKTYAGNFVTSPNYLNKYEGTFVMIAGSAATLTFPAVKNTAVPGNGRIAGTEITEKITQNRNPLSSDNWEVLLNLKDSKHSLDFGGLGMNPKASLSFDQWDDFTVPRFLEYLELDHAKKLYGAPYTKDVVPTAENYEWTFDVESSQEGNIEMNWDNTYFGDNDEQLILWDVKQQIPISMREQNKYTINPSAGKSFKVFFGGKDYVKEKTMPDKMVFHSVFPNPSAGKFTFAFSTTARPEDKWVSLEVVDMLGRKVATITQGNYEPGYHEVNWDAVDSSGSQLSGGFYLTMLKNSISEIPKKIILKK